MSFRKMGADMKCISFVMAACALAVTLAACETARVPSSSTTGLEPTILAPDRPLIPTINIAPALGWPAGAKPVSASGTTVTAFASELDHPRWVYVLPNGDVLVADDVGNFVWRVTAAR